MSASLCFKATEKFKNCYVKSLELEGVNVNDSSLSFGSPFICTCLVLCIPPPDETVKISPIYAYETVVKFTVLYIYVDSYLDSTEVSKEEKKEFLSWLKDPTNTLSGKDEICSKLLRIRSELESCHKDASIWLQLLAENTVHSTSVQYSAKATKKMLKEVCIEKGACTLLTIYKLVYGSETKEEENIKALGGCIQMLDDIMDCNKDINCNIRTYCTYTYLKNLNLDKCYRTLMRMLNNISNKYSLIVCGIKLSLRYTVFRSTLFSINLRLKLGLPPYCTKNVPSFLHCLEKYIKQL